MAPRLRQASCLTAFRVSVPLPLLLLPLILFSAGALSADGTAGTQQHQARSLLTRRVNSIGPVPVPGSPYAGALPLAIDFFEGQRSGRINGSGSASWRGNSGLKDGSDVKVSYAVPTAFPDKWVPCAEIVISGIVEGQYAG